MALENMPLSELVAIDNTYAERMKIRRQVMHDHPASTLACNTPAEPAVFEFYEWAIGTYLPRRFPTLYHLTSPRQNPDMPKSSPPPYLLNKLTAEHIPLDPGSAMDALRILGSHIDTDFLFLLPSSATREGAAIYHLEAFVTCFPSGFSTREKLGQPLAVIHKPVPGYAAKLERSMDRFFARLEVGKAVRRANWSITTNDELFTEEGTHMYEDESEASLNAAASSSQPTTSNPKTLAVDSPDLEGTIDQQRQEVVISNCRLRCERQTLHRLPKTKALVFAFKTYQYKLENVKAEGDGPALADAIEGLSKGSVPDMAFYKRQVVWGDKVVEYLRS